MKVEVIEKKNNGTVLELVKKSVQREMAATMEVREATTGRVVGLLPQLWAVGTPVQAPSAPVKLVASPGTRPRPELAFYRKYTEALLRRYAHMSMESGRVPSLLGKEMFRGRVTSYRVHGFDDVVIFCCDMEKCMKRLDETDQKLIKRIALQEYTQAEVAPMFGMSLRGCVIRYGKAVDRLTRILLEARMLESLTSCQEG